MSSTLEHVIEHVLVMVDSLVMVNLALKASTADHSEREPTNVFKKEAVLFQEQQCQVKRELQQVLLLGADQDQDQFLRIKIKIMTLHI